MATVISVLNQKGGVGKTTLTVHIAAALPRQGKKVLLIDADPQGSALDWAAARMNLGIARSRRLRGDRAGNLEDAITAYREALEVWTPEVAPVDHAMARTKRFRANASAERSNALMR